MIPSVLSRQRPPFRGPCPESDPFPSHSSLHHVASIVSLVQPIRPCRRCVRWRFVRCERRDIPPGPGPSGAAIFLSLRRPQDVPEPPAKYACFSLPS